MTDSEHYTKLENMMHSASFVQLTGARVSNKKGEAHITLPVKKDFYHAAGAMHGALYFLALDNAAFFAANSLVKNIFVLTTSFTTYITRPVSEGVVKAIGKVVNQNRSQFICESVLYDSNGKEIARATGIFVRSKIPLSDKIGYK
ncbi:MAG: PaaI family thioesterase [Desulfobacula sp.]|uniref:PaaI family thioesterase n=1 Tax=Desulfobacula sp. TaxID=2593537 RepID=UPI0025C5EF78|nr:PaaI family thioesterase [Desulfobacula sp.]MCD4719444.1 PaaI family thioesterase [Desulfobacula sp.]